MQPQRRRQYLINKPFQLKIMLYLSLLVAGVVGFAHILATTYAKLVTKAVSAASVSKPVAASLPTGFMEGLWLPVLAAILVGIVFVMIAGLLYSHKIAGPLFNLKRVMQRVQNGDLSTLMRIRSGDELHDVEAAFNFMVVGLNQRLINLRQAILDLPEKDSRHLLRLFHEHFHTGEEIDTFLSQKIQVP
ncbi:MAG: HAMP domain-containing protein [candidate division FCPU426 bacterium]